MISRWAALLIVVLPLGACGSSLPPIDGPVRPATGPVIVIANQDHGVATVVDVAEWRRVAHVDAGMNPHEGAASPDGRIVALASPSTWLGDARKVAVIDPRSTTLLRSIDLDTFRWPHGIAFADPRTLIVSSRTRAGILFVDAETGAALASAEAPGSQPYLLHIARVTGRIYVSSPATNAIAEYDLPSRTLVRQIAVAGEPAGFNVSPDGRALWVSTGSHEQGGTLVVIDAASGSTQARLPLPGHARRLAFTHDGSRVVATDVIANSVIVFDAEKRVELGRIPLGDGIAPSGVACEPAGSKCYVATSESGELIEVDVAAQRVLRRMAVGSGADGVVFVDRPGGA